MRMPPATLIAIVALAACGGSARHESPPPKLSAARPAPRAPHLRHPSASPAAAVRRFARLGRPLYCGARRGHVVALTFDDGPGPYTRLALRALRRARARATFFLVGSSIAHFPRWPRRERAVAAIGDHTETHPYLPRLPLRAAVEQIAAGRAAAAHAAGGPIALFRPPFGGRTPAIDRAVRRLGLLEVMWSVDSSDSWTSPPQDFRAISARVRRLIRPGSIVLLHENRGQTIRALRTILPALRRRGLRAVTLPQLLADDPPSRVALAAGARGCRG